MKNQLYTVFTIGIIQLIEYSSALNNGLGLTPPMGWNSWNRYNCDGINQTIVLQNADQFLNLGLDKVGYNYVNIDDCWGLAERDANNHVVPDPVKFPNGIKYVSDYVHSKGLKFGIYSSAGTLTCQERAGSLTYEQIDAADYAAWDVDFLKYDNCYSLDLPSYDRYVAMKDALLRTGRDIYFSMCNWGQENVALWGNTTSNSWRTTYDILNNWQSMKSNFLQNAEHPESAGPGGWNDPDMLQIGNGGLTLAEERSHFALWCFAKAPLLLGNDLTNMTQNQIQIIKNKNLIKVNQDSWGLQARCVSNCASDIQVWGAKQGDDNGYFAALVINWNEVISQSAVIDFVLIGATNSAKKSCSVYDIWTGTYIGSFQGVFFTNSIASHDNAAFKIKCTVANQDENEQYQNAHDSFLQS